MRVTFPDTKTLCARCGHPREFHWRTFSNASGCASLKCSCSEFIEPDRTPYVPYNAEVPMVDKRCWCPEVDARVRALEQQVEILNRHLREAVILPVELASSPTIRQRVRYASVDPEMGIADILQEARAGENQVVQVAAVYLDSYDPTDTLKLHPKGPQRLVMYFEEFGDRDGVTKAEEFVGKARLYLAPHERLRVVLVKAWGTGETGMSNVDAPT